MITRAIGSVEFPRFTPWPRPIPVRAASTTTAPSGACAEPIGSSCIGTSSRAAAGPDRHPPADPSALQAGAARLVAGEPSAAARGRVEAARDRQRQRWGELGVSCNAHPRVRSRRLCVLSSGAEALTNAVERFALTGRGFDRAIKVGRTVADLAGEERIGAEHLAEALSYRTGFGTEALADAV